MGTVLIRRADRLDDRPSGGRCLGPWRLGPLQPTQPAHRVERLSPPGLEVPVRAQGGELMPTYEYRCGACGHGFITVMSISEHDKAKTPCPKCKSDNVQQAVSAVFVKTSRKS